MSQEIQGPYSLVERSDWSRYDNGKYTGHVYREVRASIIPQRLPYPAGSFANGAGNAPANGDRAGAVFQYRGNFFVMEETLRDMRQSARAVDMVIPASFRIDRDRGLLIENDRGFPAFRNFPVFPPDAIRPGSKWTARGHRAVDPLNEGKPVVIPLVAEYEYRGVEEYRNVPVHRIFAKYASRYEGQSSFNDIEEGQSLIQKSNFNVQGAHNVDILLRVSDGVPLLIRDNLDETFSWPNGSTLRFRGFTLTFGDGLIPLDREAIIIAANTVKQTLPPDTGIDMSSVPEGVKLTVKDIRFAPDSDEMLVSERPRLDIIARVLKETPDRTFLVEGHTAAVGRPAGEMELSVQRAKRMVDELVSRGIPADRFIYKGWGGTMPIGDNTNEEGRRLNRRVEITILE
ncbi:OmpA family protein [Treponema primitia ZAS-2]|uniref:OmpA family protein n=1 Tax=Treponema primitia (strain ATCC BAA-887 / DSM 12427 / ZAS-2) TaxID=545694 RepID=F5YJN3_TREPZ|nr:OmpA family protein [Treponema primitia ZAS-2]